MNMSELIAKFSDAGDDRLKIPMEPDMAAAQPAVRSGAGRRPPQTSARLSVVQIREVTLLVDLPRLVDQASRSGHSALSGEFHR